MRKQKQTKPQRCRLHLDVPIDFREKLEKLAEMRQSTSITELMKRAVALYEYVVVAESEGANIIVRSSSGSETEVKFF